MGLVGQSDTLGLATLHAPSLTTDVPECHWCACFSRCPGNSSALLLVPSQGSQTLQTISPAKTINATELSQHPATLVSSGVTCRFPFLFGQHSPGQNPLHSRIFSSTIARRLSHRVSLLLLGPSPPHTRTRQTGRKSTTGFYSQNLLRHQKGAARPPRSAETVWGCPDHCPASAARPHQLLDADEVHGPSPAHHAPSEKSRAAQPFYRRAVGGRGAGAGQRLGPPPGNSVAP